jgi:AcrR family transcriptional regulator
MLRFYTYITIFVYLYVICTIMDANNASPKYNEILKKGQELFWKYGLKKVSIEEICREARVSKMTFYRYFPDKTSLAKLILNKIFDKGMEDYKKLMQEDRSFEEKVKNLVLLKYEGTREISSELVRDMYSDEKNELRIFWEEKTSEFTQVVKADFAKAQENGWMRKDIKLDFFFYFNSKISELVNDPKLLSMYSNVQELIMEITNMFFYGIFPPTLKDHE